MNKLTLNEIVGYLPYGLKAEISLKSNPNTKVIRDVGFLDLTKDDSCIYVFKPILNRIEDMSEELLDKWIYIQERVENNLQFSIKANEFMYSNHIDIHNLIDRGLAVDAKTIKHPHQC